MTRIFARFAILPVLFGAIALAGCLGDSNPASTSATNNDPIGSIDTESANGGYSETDEAPAFDDEAILKAEVIAEEPLANGVVGDALLEANPGYEVHFVRIAWGQLDGDSTSTSPTDWTGSVSVDRGAVKLVHTVFFERPWDHIVLPRTERKSLEFVSHTTVHFDGLLLRIYSPLNDSSGTSNTVTFATGPFSHTYELSELDSLSEVFDVDAIGNQVAFRGGMRPPPSCATGYMAGYWMMNRDATRGRFGGAWIEQDGRPRGHLRGHFGVNDAGERVLFGKFISASGEFRGTIRGTYEPNGDGTGTYSGVWMRRGGGIEGRFSGKYEIGGEGRRVHGFFEGGWSAACFQRG